MSIKINLNDHARVQITATGLDNLVNFALRYGYKSEKINDAFKIEYIDDGKYKASCVLQMKDIQEVLGDNIHPHAYSMQIEFLGAVE